MAPPFDRVQGAAAAFLCASIRCGGAANQISSRAPTPRSPPEVEADSGLRRDLGLNEAREACRVDVWLWRARFFKTRSLAARVVDDGGVRLSRGGSRAALDKPSRLVHCGDVLAFVQGSRWLAVRVEALGARRGPATEARALYSLLHEPDASER